MADMLQLSAYIDFERDVEVSMHKVRDGCSVDKREMRDKLCRMAPKALLLWREASSPQDFATDIGLWVRVRKWSA